MLVTTMIAGTTLTTNFIADETDKKNNATDYIVVTNNEKALEEANDICSVYEDNSNFYSRRFEEAYLACEQVGIEGYKTPDIYVFKPSVNDAGTSVKLWDFKNYAIKANYSSDILEENEWKICTSSPKKVDSNGNVVNK